MLSINIKHFLKQSSNIKLIYYTIFKLKIKI